MSPNLDNSKTVFEELKIINGQLQRLNNYLVDDLLTGEPGLVKKVREHKERLEKLELKEKIRDVRAGMWGAIASIILLLVKFLFEFFKK